MSFDLNLTAVCNHRIYRELSTLASDRRSLRVSKPIATTANVNVYASDELVPKVDYIIVTDPVSPIPNLQKMVYFKEKWKAVEDYFEVSYNVLGGYCSKCLARGTLYDWSYDVRGQLSTVINENLLMQNVEKFTITELQSNPFHMYIGTSLVTLLGQRLSDVGYMTTRVTQEIQTTLGKLKDMQQQYARTGRAVTPGELLDQVVQVNVTQDTNDPTILRADITVTAQSGKTLSYTQFMSTASTTNVGV